MIALLDMLASNSKKIFYTIAPRSLVSDVKASGKLHVANSEPCLAPQTETGFELATKSKGAHIVTGTPSDVFGWKQEARVCTLQHSPKTSKESVN